MEPETEPSPSQNARLYEAIGGMRSPVRATTMMPENARLSIEEMVRDLSRETIELAEKARDATYRFFRLEDEFQTKERAECTLVVSGLIASALEHLADTAQTKPIPDRLASDIKKLGEIADEFRDIEETLALGRSASFQQELQEAKRQAAK